MGTDISASHLDVTNHPDVNGAEVWVQRTVISGFHFGDARLLVRLRRRLGPCGRGGDPSALHRHRRLGLRGRDHLARRAGHHHRLHRRPASAPATRSRVARWPASSPARLTCRRQQRTGSSTTTEVAHEDNINRIAEAAHHQRLQRNRILPGRFGHARPDGQLPVSRSESAAPPAPTTSAMTTAARTRTPSTASPRPASRPAARRPASAPAASSAAR